MACYHPLDAFVYVNAQDGKRAIRFNPPGEAIKLPCGQCVGCRLDRSLQWAVRCMHEASLHEQNTFITLTYAPKHLPADGSLNKAHFQKFMKRLRKRYTGRRVRYFHCGEYGDQLSRPHYHACLFGIDFTDKEAFRKIESGYLYTSKILSELWPFGFSTCGDVTFESAAYVARYCVKKINGEQAHGHYCNRETGEVIHPEYTTMSRRPGIGRAWYDRYSSDVFPYDECIVSGRPVKPPRYYETRYQLEDPEGHQKVKEKRLARAKELAHDNTPARLAAKEKVKKAQLGMLKRELEND